MTFQRKGKAKGEGKVREGWWKAWRIDEHASRCVYQIGREGSCTRAAGSLK